MNEQVEGRKAQALRDASLAPGRVKDPGQVRARNGGAGLVRELLPPLAGGSVHRSAGRLDGRPGRLGALEEQRSEAGALTDVAEDVECPPVCAR